ncbi:hypothetical protein PTTG_30722, partial [Puccinia triticina 1-1 BBBD Race 1]
MEETSQQSRDSNTNSAPQPRRGFEELESALPPLGEDFLQFPQEETLPPDTGIPPALYNPRETSLALASNRSTPVPRPVEREQMIPPDSFQTTNPQPPQPTNQEGLRPGTSPDLALHPFAPTQPPVQQPAETHAPMEIIQEESEIASLVHLFNDQFDLFVRARESQNVRTMRMILSQAATTQDLIEELVGREDSLRLCQEWIPRAELNELERSLYNRPPTEQPPPMYAPPTSTTAPPATT